MKISIVICTYNPEPEIIGGLYQSIADLKWPEKIDKEVLLIDNASTEPLSEDEDVKTWQAKIAVDIRVIRENKPGLSNARIRGFKEADGDIIVCFDDDNKPAENYIETVARIEKEYPFVGIWGPGRVEVEWMPGADPAIKEQFEDVYQEHSQDSVTYALDFVSPNTMPYGTGMVLRREVAEAYVKWFEEKERGTTDRIGKSLVSYGDVQICWLGMEAGWAVGRHPDLRLKHVISADKAQWDYLGRLKFGMYSSYAPALKEALPHRYHVKTPSSVRLIGFLAYQWLSWVTKSGAPPLNVYIAKQLGQPTGAWKAAEADPPWWMKKLVNLFYKT